MTPKTNEDGERVYGEMNMGDVWKQGEEYLERRIEDMVDEGLGPLRKRFSRYGSLFAGQPKLSCTTNQFKPSFLILSRHSSITLFVNQLPRITLTK